MPNASFMENFHEGVDHIIAHGEEIPRILKYTQIITLYSFLETRLGLLCDEINRRNPDLLWKPSDFSGNMGLGSFEIFLSKALDARISVWPMLDTLRLVGTASHTLMVGLTAWNVDIPSCVEKYPSLKG